jgi:hypothetical protein
MAVDFVAAYILTPNSQSTQTGNEKENNTADYSDERVKAIQQHHAQMRAKQYQEELLKRRQMQESDSDKEAEKSNKSPFKKKSKDETTQSSTSSHKKKEKKNEKKDEKKEEIKEDKKEEKKEDKKENKKESDTEVPFYLGK